MREGGGQGGGQVEGERPQEDRRTSEAVRQVGEEESADAGAGDVDPGRDPDLALGEPESAARFGDPRGDDSDDRDLDAVEDPDGAETEQYHPMPASPGEPIQPSGDVGADLPE